MPNIYLRVPSYVAQFYRAHDKTAKPMAENQPYQFCCFQHEYIVMQNTLRLIPENEQTSSWCYSQRAWNNIMAGKAPTGGKPILQRDRQQWPAMCEICLLTGEKNQQKMDGYDYLCIEIPQEVMMGDVIRSSNASYSLPPKDAMALCRLLRDEYVHVFMDWLIQDRRYCNKIGLQREIGVTIERFFERYYIFVGVDRKERETMYRMARRWIDMARAFPNDRVDFSGTDFDFVSEKEEQQLEDFDFAGEIDKEMTLKAV